MEFPKNGKKLVRVQKVTPEGILWRARQLGIDCGNQRRVLASMGMGKSSTHVFARGIPFRSRAKEFFGVDSFDEIPEEFRTVSVTEVVRDGLREERGLWLGSGPPPSRP